MTSKTETLNDLVTSTSTAIIDHKNKDNSLIKTIIKDTKESIKLKMYQDYLVSSRLNILHLTNDASSLHKYQKTANKLADLSETELNEVLGYYTITKLLKLATLKPFNFSKDGTQLILNKTQVFDSKSKIDKFFEDIEIKKLESTKKAKETKQNKVKAENEKIESDKKLLTDEINLLTEKIEVLENTSITSEDIKTALSKAIFLYLPKAKKDTVEKIIDNAVTSIFSKTEKTEKTEKTA